MKIPARPPLLPELWREIHRSGRMEAIVQQMPALRQQDRYFHWDELRFRTPPAGLTHREWWFALKLMRDSTRRDIPLADSFGRTFAFTLPDPIPERLHEIDLGAGGGIEVPAPILNPQTRDRYYVTSLIDEAITSSQLEGATTTRRVAEEMLRTKRSPRDRSERMILNNYLTMRAIGELKSEPLSKDVVLGLHRMVTQDTLDEPTAAGRFRAADEEIAVVDFEGNVFHHPPAAEQLEARMSEMCAFANRSGDGPFIHPVLRAIILHFWLAFDHPFVDGNGRTARALFYWSMLRHGFWLCEYISISQVILKAPVQYGRAFLLTETDDNDLTYFILYHLKLLKSAIEDVHAYVRRQSRRLEELDREVKNFTNLNYRQRDLISHALRHPGATYTVQSHRTSHNVVYETARSDLLELVERGLLEARKRGKAWAFSPTADLESRLARRWRS